MNGGSKGSKGGVFRNHMKTNVTKVEKRAVTFLNIGEPGSEEKAVFRTYGVPIWYEI